MTTKTVFSLKGLMLAATLAVVAAGSSLPLRAQNKSNSGAAVNSAPKAATLIAAADDSRMPGAVDGVDMKALQDQMTAFQSVINARVQDGFELPFAILQDAEGGYLPHYGAVFHLEVNLYVVRMQSAIDFRPNTPEELAKARQSKIEREKKIREILTQLMLDHGADLTALPPDQNVAIAVHLFNVPSEQMDGMPSHIILETNRRTLLNAKSAGLTAKDFSQMGVLLEY